jgi:hypothetical protein
LVHHIRRPKYLRLFIDLLQLSIVHLFLVYPDGMPRQLKLLDLILMMFPLDDKLEVKRNMVTLH